jgi:cell division protein FtsL
MNEVNQNISGFLGSVLSPVNAFLGTTKKTEQKVTEQGEASKSSSKTATIIISILAVVTLVVIAVVIFKQSKNS